VEALQRFSPKGAKLDRSKNPYCFIMSFLVGSHNGAKFRAGQLETSSYDLESLKLLILELGIHSQKMEGAPLGALHGDVTFREDDIVASFWKLGLLLLQ
jgi:hypothetical protein